MHENRAFYLTLPSDASIEDFPNNTASDWHTKLKHAIQLKGQWEVALVELQYLNSLFTLQREQVITLYIITEATFVPPDERIAVAAIYSCRYTEHDVIIPPGNYQSAERLLETINSLMPTMPDYILKPEGITVKDTNNGCPNNKALHFRFMTPTDHRVVISTYSQRVWLKFPKDSALLQRILGFEKFFLMNGSDIQRVTRFMAAKKSDITTTEEFLAEKRINTLLENQSLFVYCDIADFSYIGDSSAQVLRVVPIRGKIGEVVNNIFDSPHYVPVLPSYFETLHLTIANDSGENVKFEIGKSLVKLHFRPVRLY